MATSISKDSSTKLEVDFNDPIARTNHVQELEASVAKKEAELAKKEAPRKRILDILKYPLGMAVGTGGVGLTIFVIALMTGTGVGSMGLVPGILGAIAVAMTASAAYYGAYKNNTELVRDRKELKALREELSIALDPIKAKTKAQEKQNATELEAIKIAAGVAKSEAEAKKAQAEVQKAQAEVEKAQANAEKAQAEAVKKSLESPKEDKTAKHQEQTRITQVVTQVSQAEKPVIVGRNNGPDFSDSKFRGLNANLNAYIIGLQEADVIVDGGNTLSRTTNIPSSAQRLNLNAELPYLQYFNFAKMTPMQRKDIFDAVTQNGGPLHKDETDAAVKSAVSAWANKEVFLGQMPAALREKTAPAVTTSSGSDKKFAGTVATKSEDHKSVVASSTPTEKKL